MILQQEAALETLGSTRYGARSAVPDTCFWRAFREVADAHPDRTAIVASGRRITYGQLSDMSISAITHFRRKGLLPGDLVGFQLSLDEQYIAALLAVFAMGCIYMPLHQKDSSERTEYILKTARPKLWLGKAETGKAALPECTTVTDLAELFEPVSSGSDVPLGHAGNGLAYIIFTSGTTGRPKGVRISHRSYLHFLYALKGYFRLTPEDRILGYASPSFDVSVMEIGIALLSGSALVIPRARERLDPGALHTLMRNEGVSVAELPQQVALGLPDKRLQDLRIISLGGETISKETVNHCLSIARTVVNGYGPTEATVAVTQQEFDTKIENEPTIGTPMDNVCITLLDDETLQPVPPGQIGEIAIGGPCLMQGYLAETEINSPFLSAGYLKKGYGNHLYRTGDYGRWNAHGELEYLGRVDNQVKVNGHRIELNEIERVVRSCPTVSFAAVTAEKSLHSKVLIAHIAWKVEGQRADYNRHMERNLPRHMIPKTIISYETLPITTTGKVDRSQLSRNFVLSNRQQKEDQVL